jgi:hypothetical protein
MTIDVDFSIGGTTLPLTSSIAANLLRDSDKPIVACLGFVRTVLAHHLQARFQAELTRSMVQIPSNLDGYIVAQSVPYRASDWLEETQFRFPLISLHRTEDKYSFLSTQVRQSESTWELEYIMPAMDARMYQHLQPIPRLVALVLRGALEDGDDASFLGSDGYTTNWGEGCGIAGCTAIDSKFSMYELAAEGKNTKGGAGLLFPFVRMTLHVTERQETGPATLTNTLDSIALEVDSPEL